MKVLIFSNCLSLFNDYIINCDFLIKDENLFNSDFLMVFGYFDVSGRFFEWVKYFLFDFMMRRIVLKNYILVMWIFVIDEIGSIINFNGYLLRFKVEVIECFYVIKCY